MALISAKDRTKEFLSAVATAQRTSAAASALPGSSSSSSSTSSSSSMAGGGRLGSRDDPGVPLLTSPGSSSSSSSSSSMPRTQFALIAKQIAMDINSTFGKLERLSALAKKKSLFDDRPVEIQELTYIIKQSIGQLNEQIAQLQRSQSGSKRREQEKKHSDNVVVSLQSKLANMSKEFKSVLEVRTQNLKDQQERREHYSTGPALAGSLDAPSSSGGAGSIALDLTGSNYQQMQLVDKQDAYIRSREDAVTTIESTIVELGGIFQQLGTLIHEQGQMVERIDANIEETEVNINLAHSEIAKYFENISSNRWLMIKIFAVLIVFFIVFVVFFA